MDTELIERVAGMTSLQRQSFWNSHRTTLAPKIAAAKTTALSMLDARKTIAQAQLRQACGPALAALEFQRDEAVAALKAQQAAALAAFEQQWQAHIDGQFAQPRAAYDAEIADAQAQYDAAVAAAEQELVDFTEAFREGKALAKARAQHAKRLATPAGQQEAAEAARAAKLDRDELAFAITSGWPPMWWLRWQQELNISMGGSDGPGSRWAQAEPLREEYLKHYPEQRAMIESPTQDLYAAWVTERGGESERPTMPVTR